MKKYLPVFKRPFFFYHMPAILFAAAIFILSSIPKLNPPNLGFELQDKFYHFLLYTAFGFVVARSFSALKLSGGFHKYYLLLAILFSAMYGLSDELHQSYVPGRYSSISDFIADALGATAGVLLFHFRQSILLFLNRFWWWKK